MGVPGFFRWLSRKYSSIVVNAIEEGPKEVDGVKEPIDCTKPNLNYQEFDNFYIDLNAIIHNCTHPEDRPAPKTEEEMFVLIFEYIDRLFSIVRPRKLLYMAVDGVAPRAKMNQQRSRRFRASKEAADKSEQIAEIRRKLESEGIPLPPPRKEEEHFDSNCITPGTPIMARLAVALRYYIHMRITYDPAWKKIRVILSDSKVPGEGEHKIMDFVRQQHASPSYNPKTVHCICGADADLIMLGLATHEANFNIIREEFIPNQLRTCELCGQFGHELENCKGLARTDCENEKADKFKEKIPIEAGISQLEATKQKKTFIFVRLPILREHLKRDLSLPHLPFNFDLERAIDDWVMLCSFVGNDFLPHLLSMEIHENAIDRLVALYKNMVYQSGRWLTTQEGGVNLKGLKMIMAELGKQEDAIFRERRQRELQFKQSQRQFRYGEEILKMPAEDRLKVYRCAAEQPRKLKTLLGKVTSALGIGLKRKAGQDLTNQAPSAKTRRPAGLMAVEGSVLELEEEDEPRDNVRLWEAGWKDRFYQAKFKVPRSDVNYRRKVACAYTEGLCWAFRYYRQGCPSWAWFYPFHYAPFASDFELIGDFQPDFSKPTRPFRPFEQMMAIFPAASSSHIPEGWRQLMTDPKSPIIDFYPEDFEVDLNGKQYSSQAFALLPFVDQRRLLEALDWEYDRLTPEEQMANTFGSVRLFVGKEHALFDEQVEKKRHDEQDMSNGKMNNCENDRELDEEAKSDESATVVREKLGEEEGIARG